MGVRVVLRTKRRSAAGIAGRSAATGAADCAAKDKAASCVVMAFLCELPAGVALFHGTSKAHPSESSRPTGAAASRFASCAVGSKNKRSSRLRNYLGFLSLKRFNEIQFSQCTMMIEITHD